MEINALYNERRGVYWGIVHRESGGLIGTCGFLHWFRGGIDAQRAELGFTLSRLHWRKGYSAEACMRAIQFGLEEMGLNRIEANLTLDNIAGEKLLLRLGFRHEGHLRQRFFWDGCFHDVNHYAVLKDDFD